MKTDTHPQYFTDAKITCANCNNVLVTGATHAELKVEICSKCHPFYTGKKVLIDTEGRVDKFRMKLEGAGGRIKKKRGKKTLEERMNEEIAAQLGVQKEQEEKEKTEREERKAKKRKEVAKDMAEAVAAITETETPEAPEKEIAAE